MTSIDAVEQRFRERMVKLKKTFDDESRTAEEERARGLEQVVEYAMDRRDLDLAVRARGAMEGRTETSHAPGTKPTDTPRTAPPPQLGIESAEDLRRNLTGSRWAWGRETLVFQPDGTIRNAGWTSRGLVTEWQAIDRRTAIFVITKGRNHNLLSVLTFNDKVDSYDVFDFEGGRPVGNRRLDR